MSGKKKGKTKQKGEKRKGKKGGGREVWSHKVFKEFGPFSNERFLFIEVRRQVVVVGSECLLDDLLIDHLLSERPQLLVCVCVCVYVYVYVRPTTTTKTKQER